MRDSTLGSSRWLHALALGVVVAVSGVLAVLLHRNGHTQGDDFALYIRQARSLFDGDVGAVVADNRFAVLNSDSAFSPIAYPWVWPLLLSPFVFLWDYDYDRLKLVEVMVFMVWLVLLHGIVRRRLGRTAALAVVAVIGTAPLYLEHTDELLTEFPYLAAVAIFLWWYDRIRAHATLLTASRAELVTLGAFVTLAFNVRREGLVLVGVIAVMQLYDVLVSAGHPVRIDGVIERVRTTWSALVTPFVAFGVSAAAFQLVLPTALFPDNGNSTQFIDDRLGEYPEILTDQLGLGEHPLLGIAILGLAAAGAVIGVHKRPALDAPLLLLTLASALAISTHLRKVDRYWFQITPWIVYFCAVALLAAGALVIRRHHTIGRLVAVVPLVAIVMAHLVVLPGKVGDAREFDAAGRVQSGPSNPSVAPIFEAVSTLTPPDAVIAYFRARTMTLLTDRRSFQTKNLERIAQNADYFAQRRNSTFWQPTLELGEARRAGFEEVWSNASWILWRTPRDDD